jgi:hypothetical protein
MYLYPLTKYCIYLYILRYGVQEVKENVCSGFYEEESRFSVFVVLREEGGGKVLELKRMNGGE